MLLQSGNLYWIWGVWSSTTQSDSSSPSSRHTQHSRGTHFGHTFKPHAVLHDWVCRKARTVSCLICTDAVAFNTMSPTWRRKLTLNARGAVNDSQRPHCILGA
eukprot:6480868-Amphidinium_carterae.1